MAAIDFAFNWYALLSVLAIVTSVIVIYLVINAGSQLLAHRLFSMTIILLIVWACSEALVRFSNNPYAANFWYLTGAPGWLFMAPLFFSFVLAYVGKEKFLYNLSNLFILFSPAAIFLYLA